MPLNNGRPRACFPGAFRACWLVLAVAMLQGCRREAEQTPSSIPAIERSRIGGAIAFVSERDGNREVYLISPATGRLERVTNHPDSDYPSAFVPDGGGLLVLRAGGDSANHAEGMWLYPRDAGAPVSLGIQSARVRNPGWSPDGKWIYFESDARSFRDIYRVDAGGKSLRRLTDNREGNFAPAVAPDGGRIAFVSSRDGNAQIYTMNADGSDERRVTAFHRDDWSPGWSPDGKMIAFLSAREGVTRIFLMNADGTGQHRLTKKPSTSTGVASDSAAEEGIAWSPDGKKIAYVARESGSARILIADLASGAQTALTGGATIDDSPEWSPDGRYIAFVSQRDGDPELYIMRSDGSGATRLTNSRGADWLPKWGR